MYMYTKDHMLGYLRANRSEIDGCLPSLGSNCSNPVNPQYPNEDLIFVDSNAVYVQPGDPDHSIPGTTTQLFGLGSDDVWPPPMNGFVYDYAFKDTKVNDNGTIIMQCFDPSAVPIITTLANEFGVYDRWYCDVPGPTDPNRLYAWMATSSGLGDNTADRLIAGCVGPNVFQVNFCFVCKKKKGDFTPLFGCIFPILCCTYELNEKMLDETISFTNNTWRVYYEQAPSPIYVEYTRKFPRKFRQMETFFVDLNSGDLPLFSWLDPAYFALTDFPASDEHPDHDVTNGEKLMKRVYESLRQSPVWEDSLLLIFYDEHGGFFDHGFFLFFLKKCTFSCVHFIPLFFSLRSVPPPLAVSPDGRVAEDVYPPFNFTRYGIRVPAVLVSPYIQKGSVGDRPDPGSLSQYSHSSLPHTIREQFSPDYPPYNDREDIALTFEQMLNLEYPRDDCPTKLPDVPTGQSPFLYDPKQQPVNSFQFNLANAIAPLCGASQQDVTNHGQNQDMLGRFVIDCAQYFASSD
ncbi:phosphoesterase family protein [Reticulomyxa filosa]|uniref:Phosphoesterase family protein n=1 Tax=Reticulomyxa filosa TaxID=46433 RepID=X6P204_RETFI|nr:phosphoesterase family protein [Reticulomyxa filosa]|eukprot:ETO31587.1 phosphoesterase family protein [Reticulomyxa filosa]